MGKHTELAQSIIKNVGGKENITELSHCVTRLRFKLKDETKANKDSLTKTEGIVTVLQSAGQYMVVIGTHVREVYTEVMEELGGTLTKTDNTKSDKKMTIGQRIIDLLSGIFMPIISVMTASGILKGLLAISTFAGLLKMEDGLYMLLNGIADGMFMFMPIAIGYSAAKKLKMTPMLGIAMGMALTYPALQNVDLTILGLTIKATYTNTVLPIILMSLLAAPLERKLKQIIPSVIANFMVPLLTLLIVVPLGFILIGPAATMVSGLISTGINNLYGIQPILTGLIVGGLYQVMIIFGIHSVLITVLMLNILGGNPDPIWPLLTFVSFAQTAVVFGIWIKTKDRTLKNIALPAWISGIFGVTEPALYGVTLPRIKFFIISCIGAALAGGWLAAVGARGYMMTGIGVFGISALINPNDVSSSLFNIGIALVLSVGFSLIATLLLYKDDKVDTVNEENEITIDNEATENITITSPLEGKVIDLIDIQDDAFSSGVLGNGVGIEPMNNEVRSPLDGFVTTLFPTKHAVGITSNEGVEVLIHVGMNTVELEGKYFTALVKQGDQVTRGQKLIEFDAEKIEEAGYSLQTPVIVTNTNDYQSIWTTDNKEATQETPILRAIIL